MQVSRRHFFKICAGGMAGTTVAALGFAPELALAETRQYKLLRARETRNNCTYCSVGCGLFGLFGLLMYSLGDGAKNVKESIFHIEGDPDHPVNRGALCPKGAGLLTSSTVKAASSIRNTVRLARINGSVSVGTRPLPTSPS